MHTLAWAVAILAGLFLTVAGAAIRFWRLRRRADLLVARYRSEPGRQTPAQHLDSLAQYANDITLLADEQGRIIEANDRAVAAYGYTRDELLALYLRDLHPAEGVAAHQARFNKIRQEHALLFETVHRRRDGTTFPVEVSVRLMAVEGRTLVQGIVRDITERKLTERRITRLNALYSALSETNEAIMRATERDALFAQVCRIAVEIAGFRLAWIGLAHPQRQQVTSLACHASVEYLTVRRDSGGNPAIAEAPELCELAQTALREGKTCVGDNSPAGSTISPGYQEAGIRAAAAFPLHQGGHAVGAFTVCSADPDHFDPALIGLLEQMAADISFALDRLELEHRRRQTEEALRESERKYRSVVNNTPQGFWLIDSQRRTLEVNQALCEMLGYAPDEMVGRAPQEFTDAANAAIFESQMARISVTARRSYAITLRRKDGGELYTHFNATTVHDESGRPVAAFAFVTDLTEHRRVEEALRESEARLAEAMHIAKLGSWRLDLATGAFALSREHLYLMGYPPDDPGSPRIMPVLAYVEIHVHPDDHAAMAECYRHIVEHRGDPGFRTSFEYRLLHRDGTVRALLVHVRALAGQPGMVHGVAQDITELKHAQRTLTELGRWHAQILNSAGEGILGLDAQGRHVFVNPAAARLLGYESSELIGRKSHFLWHHSHADGTVYPDTDCPIYTSLRDGQIRYVDTDVFWRKDGTAFPAAYTSTPMFDADKLTGAVVVFEDITERKRAEAVLRQSQERLRAIIENEPECVKLLDRDARVLEMNPAGLAMLEAASPAQVIGQSVYHWVAPSHRPAFQAFSERVYAGQAGRLEFEAEGLKGRRLWLETHAVPMRDAAGEVSTLLAVTRDITERKQVQEKLQHDALYDALTGLPNRVLFADRLRYCLDRSKRRPDYVFAVLFLDLDRFKVVNDSLGHLVGDALLVDIARRLECCMRPVDTVARLGGDEFSLLLDDISELNDATRIVERIQHVLARPFQHEGQEVFSTASIGIALSTMGYERPEDMMRDADTAMYRAKTSGRARFQVFDAAMHERALQVLRIETDLRYAIEREEFKLYYQPIVDTADNRLVCFEALLRWQPPQGGLVSPTAFIPIAEETGLIVPIGAWVLRTACRQLRQWQTEFPRFRDLPVSVNLSGKQFLHSGLGAYIRTLLHEAGLEGRHLKLEITESMLMENTELATEVLLQLQALGTAVCMDDFGTGYSSLSSLHGLPIDILKIDKSFVGRLERGKKNAELVRAIIDLAHSLNMTAIAEGVETREQLEYVRELQCDYAQGYLISKPLPAESVPFFLREADRLMSEANLCTERPAARAQETRHV